jgi:hypothetical protein
MGFHVLTICYPRKNVLELFPISIFGMLGRISTEPVKRKQILASGFRLPGTKIPDSRLGNLETDQSSSAAATGTDRRGEFSKIRRLLEPEPIICPVSAGTG